MPPRIIWNLLIPRKEKLLSSRNKILLSVTSISRITVIEILPWLKESVFSIVSLTSLKWYSMISKDCPEESSISNKPYPSHGNSTTIQKNNSKSSNLFCTLYNKKNPVKMTLLNWPTPPKKRKVRSSQWECWSPKNLRGEAIALAASGRKKWCYKSNGMKNKNKTIISRSVEMKSWQSRKTWIQTVTKNI